MIPTARLDSYPLRDTIRAVDETTDRPPKPGKDWCRYPVLIKAEPLVLRPAKWKGCGMCEPCYRRRTMTGEPKGRR